MCDVRCGVVGCSSCGTGVVRLYFSMIALWINVGATCGTGALGGSDMAGGSCGALGIAIEDAKAAGEAPARRACAIAGGSPASTLLESMPDAAVPLPVAAEADTYVDAPVMLLLLGLGLSVRLLGEPMGTLGDGALAKECICGWSGPPGEP
jgi:hypothetical protein